MKHKISAPDFPSSFKHRRLDNNFSQIHSKQNAVSSLLDLSSKVVAEFLPFEYVERMMVHIPEPVQEKIIYYSFPQRDSDIYTYASFHSKNDKTRDKIPYYQGLEFFQNSCVEDVIQIGFHLTGSVRQQPSPCISEAERSKFKVSITFDRCKIISVCCDCGNKGLSWCPHVVALALFRIRQPHLVDYRSPISDALVRMNRSQLQKFAQYLIASHPNKILPSAQQLADQLLQPESNINQTSGAPDPTAGGSLQDVAAWYLDEAGVREQLRVELANLASNGAISGGLYTGGGHHNTNTTRLSSGRSNSPNNLSSGFDSSAPQHPASNTFSTSASSSFTHRSNNSRPSHANSASSISTDFSVANQNDTDYKCQTDVGVDWLLRYRRLTLNQNLLIGGGVSGSTCTNSCTLNSLDLASVDLMPAPSLESSLHPESTNSRRYCSASSFHHHWSNPIDLDFGLRDSCSAAANTESSGGTQIAAMFAKVRELLAKRDSNGPRLLSLITEELLSCSKLPLLKSRRNQRNTTVDGSSRLQTNVTPGLLDSQQSSDRNYSNENSSSNGYDHSSSHSFSQPPPWTVRLWEEVSLLWTCVVLSPDCSNEAKRQWRCRFLTWARSNRCPRDESYSIPSHLLTSIHESGEVDEDGPAQNQQAQQQQQQPQSCQPSTRSYRRASIFRLPIEVSYMSWDDIWLNHLLSIHDVKSDKQEESNEDIHVSRHSHSGNIFMEDNSDCDRVFRRPSSVTPRKSNGFSRPLLSNSPRECQCPYCDFSAPLNEPFPLLCLRVAALRSNGYLSQALQLAVFISQRFLRSVKNKTSLAAATIANTVMRTPPQQSSFPSHIPWSNNCHPNDNIVARRMLFNTQSNGGAQGLRINGMSPHSGLYSGSRYMSPSNMPPSASMMTNHGKFSPSSRLTSPRPASLSPPVNVNHSRSVPPSPVPRRHGLSPNSNPSPGPSGSNHQSIINISNNNNNGNNNSNNNHINCWSSQSSYSFKSSLSSQQYVNQPPHSFSSPHCSPILPASISPIPFHNHYHYHHHHQQQQQLSNTNHHLYHKNLSHPNLPYSSYTCSLHTPNGPSGGNNGNLMGMMVHPAHHNRPLVSPNSVSRPVIGSRPLPSSHLGNGNAFTGGCSDFFLGGETDINCGLISSNCPSHSEAGWIGLPGRPIICLIECLLDAAAIVVEATNLQTRIELPSWGHMEKASFYLCLAVKVSLLTLFQQRRLVGSVSRLLACQHQEARLLTLLSTIPKDVTTVLAMCETLCHLLGPPISSRILSKLDYSSLMQLWWWSSLGLTVHSDTYPVHAVAEFVLNYLLDTQKLNQLVSFSICWIHSGNGSNNNNNLSSVRIDDMVFTLVTRAMRLSILENYGDNSAPGPSLTRSISSPQLLLSSSGVGGGGGSGNQGYTNSPRANYNYRDRDHFNNLGGHICGGGDVVVGGGLETALAVNTEVSDQEFSMPPLTSVTVDSLQFPGDSMNANFDNRQRYPHPPNTNHPASCRWDHHLQPVPDYDRSAMTTPNISSPPLPSVFAISTQNCLKSNNGSAYFNFPCNNLPVYPTYNPQNIIDTNNISTNHTHTSNFIRSARIDDIQHFEDDNQDPQYLRCLETLKLRQTRLAVALIRVSKSHIHRLDQIVQICDQNIHSTVSLLAISQQVFAEAMGWKLRSLVNRKPPSTTNLLDSTYGECACLLNGNSPASLLSPSNATNIAVETFFTRDRIYLISTAFHLALIGVLRTSRRSIYWRRREALVWAVSTVLHVGPSACLYLISHWSSYLNAREAVVWLAPALLTAMDSSDSNIAGAVSSAPRISKSLSSKVCPKGQPHPSAMEGNMCFDHSLFFRVPNWDDLPNGGGGVNFGPTIDASFSMWPSWYSFCAATFTSKNRVNSISMAAQLLSTAVPYSKIAREQIINAVRHMALQAAAKDPVNCALPALNLSEKDSAAFDAVYRLVLQSAESNRLGLTQLFSIARYMDNRGWTWRAFPFALHATRTCELSTIQESHPYANEILWACLLGHRLGPGALQEILNHVIRNVHCPTLLSDILQRCRSIPCGINLNPMQPNLSGSNNHGNINPNTIIDPSSLMSNNNMTNPVPIGRNQCIGHACNPASHYINNNNNSGTTAPGKILTLDRPPLKGLLDAAVNAFVMATHTRLANISPRQYSEFIAFLTRARDTFHLLRPDGPLQFRSLVECLRQTYRGKRKLVSLLSEKFD